MEKDNDNKKYSSNFDAFILSLAEKMACKRFGISPEDPDAREQLKQCESTPEQMDKDVANAEKAAKKIRKVLVIDDDPAIRQVLKDSLEKIVDNIFVNTAKDGEEGWSCVNDYADNYDLLICDVSMPGISGTDLITKLGEQGYNFPILLLTGLPENHSTVGALKTVSKKIDYLLKPVDVDTLVSSVTKMLSKKSRRRKVRATKALLDPLAEIGHESPLEMIPPDLARVYFRESLVGSEEHIDRIQKTLLVVHRDESLRENMRRFFKNIGYKVITRKHPETALEVIQDASAHVDLVISGYSTKKDNYSTLYKALADQNELPPIPLFLLTNQIEGLAKISPPPRTFVKGTRPGDLRISVETGVESYRQEIARGKAVKNTLAKAKEYVRLKDVMEKEMRSSKLEQLSKVLLITPNEHRRGELSDYLSTKGFKVIPADATDYETILEDENPSLIVVSEEVGETVVSHIHANYKNAFVVWDHKEKPDQDQWQRLASSGKTIFPYSDDHILVTLENERNARMEKAEPRESESIDPDNLHMEHIYYLIKDNLLPEILLNPEISQTEFGGIAGYVMTFFSSQKKRRNEGLRYRGRFQNEIWEGRFAEFILKATEPEYHSRLQRELDAIKIIHTINKEKGGSEPFIKVVSPSFPFVLRSGVGSLLMTGNEGQEVSKEMISLFNANTEDSLKRLTSIYDDIIEQEARLLSQAYRFPKEIIDVTHLPDMNGRREYYWNRIFDKVIGTGDNPFTGSIAAVFGKSFAEELRDVFSKNYGPIIDIISNAAPGLDTDRTLFNITRKTENGNGSRRISNIDFGNIRNAPNPFGSPLNIGPYPHVGIIAEAPIGFNSAIVFEEGDHITIKDKKIIDSAVGYNYHLQHTDDPDMEQRMIKDIYFHMLESYAIGVQRSLTMFANFMAWLPKDNALNLWYGKSQVAGASSDLEKAASIAVTMEFMRAEDIIPYTSRLLSGLSALSRKLNEDTPRLLNLS